MTNPFMDEDDERMGCEGNHEFMPPAIASVVLDGSQSAANVFFVCKPCLVEFVIEAFDDPEISGYHVQRA